LLVELGCRIDTALNSRCQALAAALARRRDVDEAVAGYASVTVHYRPDKVSFETLSKAVIAQVRVKPKAGPSGRLHRIPVVYDGPDLVEAAARLELSVESLVELHTTPIYRVFMVGFVPGWAYLGPLSPQIRLPRLQRPRTVVPAGSVAIAGAQTGIYPLESPGGWHLIGRTSVRPFLPDSDPPLLFHPGDRVKFFAQP
jgi:KipI family sensor histidine kinase inhibitor